MPRRGDADDEGWDDDEDVDLDDEDATIPCPHCRREIHEESERCPRCGAYLSKEDAPPSRKPWWFILGVIACFAIFYRWIFG
jgi:uncharacterized paraquat-inducible protein A